MPGLQKKYYPQPHDPAACILNAELPRARSDSLKCQEHPALPQEASCPSHSHPDPVPTSFLPLSPEPQPCLHLISLPKPAASPVPTVAADPALPALSLPSPCPCHQVPSERWSLDVPPHPMSTCSPHAPTPRARQIAGGALPSQQKAPLPQDSSNPQKENHSFHRQSLGCQQGRVQEPHLHLDPSAGPFPTSRACTRGSGPRVQG